MAEKLYYSMGEVAEMFDVNPSLIRHWESQFSVLRPKRNKKGNRLFTPQDVENLKRIYHLVKECGMTLDGAKRALRNQPSGDAAAREAELIERLQRIRALLLEVREDLRDVPGEVVGPDSAVDAASEAHHTPGPSRTRRPRRVARNDAAAREPMPLPMLLPPPPERRPGRPHAVRAVKRRRPSTRSSLPSTNSRSSDRVAKTNLNPSLIS